MGSKRSIKRGHHYIIFKIKHELVAVPKAPYLGTPPRRSRRIHENSVQIQYNRTHYLKHPLFYRAPVIWNCIQVELRTSRTVYQ